MNNNRRRNFRSQDLKKIILEEEETDLLAQVDHLIIMET